MPVSMLQSPKLPEKVAGQVSLSAQADNTSHKKLLAQQVFPITRQATLPNPHENWLQWGGSVLHHNYRQQTLTPPLKILWAKNPGGRFNNSQPVLQKGVLYFGIDDSNGCDKAAVVGLDGVTGKQLWRSPMPSAVQGSVAIEGNTVVANAVEGLCRAFDVATGKQKWDYLYPRDDKISEDGYKVGIRGKGQQPGDSSRWLIKAPAIEKGIVYTGPAPAFVALDLRDGSELWRAPGLGHDHFPCCATPAVANGQVVVGSIWMGLHLVGLDAQSGKIVWKVEDKRGNDVHAAPLILNDKVCALHRDGKLILRNLADGNIIWETPASRYWSCSSLATDGERFYVAGEGEGIGAFDVKTGKRVWAFTDIPKAKTAHLPFSAPTTGMNATPFIAGDVLYCGCPAGILFALDRQSGRELGRIDFGVPLTGSVVTSGNMLFLQTYDGSVIAMISQA